MIRKYVTLKKTSINTSINNRINHNCLSRLCLASFSPQQFFFYQASGVTVADVCKTTYEEIKKDKKHRYVIFYIKDERQIDVEVIGPRDAAYDAFLEDLQKGGSGECRYGLFDFEYTHQCQGTSEVIITYFVICYFLRCMLSKVLTEFPDNRCS